MKIEKEEIGKEYLVELNEILKIRKNRRKKWGDSFKTDSVKDLLYMVKSKIKRYEIALNIEDKRDSLRDAVNYLIFILVNLSNEENEKTTKK